jgi:hypothetical protein
MLFTPEAHEALADEPWSAERARTAIASIVADAESAFDDGWPMHPQDFFEEDNDESTQLGRCMTEVRGLWMRSTASRGGRQPVSV